MYRDVPVHIEPELTNKHRHTHTHIVSVISYLIRCQSVTINLLFLFIVFVIAAVYHVIGDTQGRISSHLIKYDAAALPSSCNFVTKILKHYLFSLD